MMQDRKPQEGRKHERLDEDINNKGLIYEFVGRHLGYLLPLNAIFRKSLALPLPPDPPNG
jgi:hypothetical protein